MGSASKQFVGSVSLGRQQGMVMLRAGATRVLFKGDGARPVKGFMGTNKISCRIMNLCASPNSRKDDRTCVPFSALRMVCGGNSGLGGLAFAAGKLAAVRAGRTFRTTCHGMVNTGRHFSPSSGDTL